MRRRRRIALLAVLLAAVAAALLVLVRDDGKPPAPQRPPVGEIAERPERAPGRRPSPPPAVPAAVRERAERMPMAEQVAQLFLVGFEGTDSTASVFAELRERGWGAILLSPQNVPFPEQVLALAGEAAVTSLDAGRVIPFVGAPEVPGFAAPVQSSGQTAAEVRAAAQSAAATLRQSGVTLVFAPDVDVSIDADEGTFGDDPQRVARLARAAVAGWRAGGVTPAPGRFPGEGGATQDPLEGPASVGLSRDELLARDLVPWVALRRAPAVVVSSAAYSAFDPVTPGVLTPAVVRDLLRDEIGFTGVAMTDDLAGAAAATGGSVAQAAVSALQAGADMLQVPDPSERENAYRAVLRAVRRGAVPRERLREALYRVLALKRSAGLLREAPASPTPAPP